jgi:hypothetical protein
MGAIHHGVPRDLVLFLQKAGGYDLFVETGTLFGESAAWASEHFSSVVTVESMPTVHERALEKLRSIPNVASHLGNSVDFLHAWEPPEAAIYWLDAHYMGPGFIVSAAGECPVIVEIAEINENGLNDVVLVDDARLFFEPPPRPHDPAQWPRLEPLVEALSQNDREVFIHEDVFVSVPRFIKSQTRAHLQNLVTKAWGLP